MGMGQIPAFLWLLIPDPVLLHPIPPSLPSSRGCWSTLQREQQKIHGIESPESSWDFNPGQTNQEFCGVVSPLRVTPPEFFSFQGEVGIGAIGPRGPRGFPGPQVGSSINIPGLDSCNFQPSLEAALSLTSHPPIPEIPEGFQAAKFPFP